MNDPNSHIALRVRPATAERNLDLVTGGGGVLRDVGNLSRSCDGHHLMRVPVGPRDCRNPASANRAAATGVISDNASALPGIRSMRFCAGAINLETTDDLQAEFAANCGTFQIARLL